MSVEKQEMSSDQPRPSVSPNGHPERGASLSRRLNKFRRWVANFIVGDQIALYLPAAQLAKQGDHLDEKMDDAALAAMARFWFATIRQVSSERADAEGLPLSVYNNIHAVLGLVRSARETNASTLTLVQSCYFGDEPSGVWRLVLEKIDDGYEFGPAGVQEFVEADGRLTEVSFSFDLSGGMGRAPCPSQTADDVPGTNQNLPSPKAP